MTTRQVMCVAVCLAMALPAAAADWTGFRGSDGKATAESTPPLEWSESKNIRWTLPLPGPGSSSPIVLGDRVFVTYYTGYGEIGARQRGALSELKRTLLCVDRNSGKELWKKEIAGESPEDEFDGFITEHGYASSTPVTDGQNVYVFFGKTGVLAFDLDGNQLWSTNVGKESSPMRWGSGASPALFEDLVIVNAGDESLSLKALNKQTGQEVWKAEGSVLEAAYGTPQLVEVESGRTDLVISGSSEVWGVNPATGKLRWFAVTNKEGSISPTVVVGDGVGYLFGGRGSPAMAVKLGGKGDVTASGVVWSGRANSNVATPVLVGGKLYWLSDRGIAYCVDAASGETVKERRIDASLNDRPVYASPVAAGDRIYCTTSGGGVFVLKADETIETLAHNVIAGDETDFNATPAIVDGELFLRSNKALYCIAEPEAAGARK